MARASSMSSLPSLPACKLLRSHLKILVTLPQAMVVTFSKWKSKDRELQRHHKPIKLTMQSCPLTKLADDGFPHFAVQDTVTRLKDMAMKARVKWNESGVTNGYQKIMCHICKKTHRRYMCRFLNNFTPDMCYMELVYNSASSNCAESFAGVTAKGDCCGRLMDAACRVDGTK